MKHCKDCEPAQEIHWVAYWSVVFGMLSQPYMDLMQFFFQRFTKYVGRRATVPFFRLMLVLRLARLTDEPDNHDTWRTKCFWEEAKRRGIKMQEFHLGPIRDIFIAEHKGRIITFDGLPRPNEGESDSLKWMDNKGIMKKKFLKVGLPVARGGVASTKRGALKIFDHITKPVITKPNLGSRSRHTTIHLNAKEELITGFKKAKKLSPFVVVEEELSGALFRGTLVDGNLIAVIRRDAPSVIGDGTKTLRELWYAENERPERKGPLYHEIAVDADAEKELRRQGITMEDVPTKGQVVTFSQKTSRGVGGTTTDVSEIVHSENKEMLEKLAAYLDDPLVGVDFIMDEVSKSWKEQARSGIIECNSLPFIDLHHYPLFGKSVNVASALWDLAIPESRPTDVS